MQAEVIDSGKDTIMKLSKQDLNGLPEDMKSCVKSIGFNGITLSLKERKNTISRSEKVKACVEY